MKFNLSFGKEKKEDLWADEENMNELEVPAIVRELLEKFSKSPNGLSPDEYSMLARYFESMSQGGARDNEEK